MQRKFPRMFSITVGISPEHVRRIDRELFELCDFLSNVLSLVRATPFLFKLVRWNHLLRTRQTLFCVWSFPMKIPTIVLHIYRHISPESFRQVEQEPFELRSFTWNKARRIQCFSKRVRCISCWLERHNLFYNWCFAEKIYKNRLRAHRH